jgi:DNA-binding response OmpR family regulator
VDAAVISMRWAGARVRRGLGIGPGRDQGLAPARVLVADDDDAIRQLIAVYLAAAGFAVELAADGAAALDVIVRVKVQAAVLDADMPPPAGWDVARRLRSDPATAAIRTVVLWPADDDDLSPSDGRVADAHLTKPFSPPELVALVQGLAGLAQPQPRLRLMLRRLLRARPGHAASR